MFEDGGGEESEEEGQEEALLEEGADDGGGGDAIGRYEVVGGVVVNEGSQGEPGSTVGVVEQVGRGAGGDAGFGRRRNGGVVMMFRMAEGGDIGDEGLSVGLGGGVDEAG